MHGGQNLDDSPDLNKANLGRAVLSGASLSGAVSRQADLERQSRPASCLPPACEIKGLQRLSLNALSPDRSRQGLRSSGPARQPRVKDIVQLGRQARRLAAMPFERRGDL